MPKTLIAKEFEVDEEIAQKKVGDQYEVGEKYSYFEDPETGKLYRPKEGFVIRANKGGDLSDRFTEVK